MFNAETSRQCLMQCMNTNEIELYFQLKIFIAKAQPSDVMNFVANNTCIVVITGTKIHCSAEK